MEWNKPRKIKIGKIDYPRGSLSVLEKCADMPFEPVDACWITADGEGAHTEGRAYFSTSHAVVALNGSLEIATEYDGQPKRLSLCRHDEIAYIPPMTWFEITGFSTDAIALIVSDALPDALDVIRDKREFDTIVTNGIE